MADLAGNDRDAAPEEASAAAHPKISSTWSQRGSRLLTEQ